jgi:hypothetical protein
MNPTLRSILYKALYGFAAALTAALLGWIQVNPDVSAWTLTSLKLALLTAAAAAVKKVIASVLVSDATP